MDQTWALELEVVPVLELALEQQVEHQLQVSFSEILWETSP